MLSLQLENLKEHEALTKHKIFLLRIQSNLDDRDSYLMSIGQALLGKPLNQIKDADETILKQRMLSIVKELDNLVDLKNVKIDEGELLVKFEITTIAEGSKDQIIRVPKNKLEELKIKVNTISLELDKAKNLKIPILVSLLKRELNKGE